MALFSPYGNHMKLYSQNKIYLVQLMMIRTQVKFTKLISMLIFYQVCVNTTRLITKLVNRFTMNKNATSYQDAAV